MLTLDTIQDNGHADFIDLVNYLLSDYMPGRDYVLGNGMAGFTIRFMDYGFNAMMNALINGRVTIERQITPTMFLISL